MNKEKIEVIDGKEYVVIEKEISDNSKFEKVVLKIPNFTTQSEEIELLKLIQSTIKK